MTPAAEVKEYEVSGGAAPPEQRTSQSSEITNEEVRGKTNHRVPGLMDLLTHFAKAFFYLFPVYLTGYFGLSIAWIVFGLFVWMWWKKNRSAKLSRLQAAFRLVDEERLVITNEIKQELPPWVHFPDVERVEWLNKIVSQAWPYIGIYLEKLFKDRIEPSICGSNVYLKTFIFSKLHFGEKVKTMIFCRDCEINVEIKKVCKAGLKGVLLHGTLRVILEPLIGQMPLVGAVTLFFIRPPTLEINWTGLTNILDIPGVNEMSDTKILDAIASYMVLPNRFTCPLTSKINVSHLRFPLPHGVVRIYVKQAADLIRKDTYLMGMVQGKSDPYAVVRIGTQTFRSKTIKGNLNPAWNEIYEAVVHEAPGQDLEVELYDEDPDKDDFLGSALSYPNGHDSFKHSVFKQWFPLNDVDHGKIHLKLEWLSLLTDQDKIYTICYNSSAPVWEQAFTFFIKNIHSQELNIEIKDKGKECVLGTLDIPLYQVLAAPDMTLNQRFQLEHSGPNSLIKMKLVLRVLSIEEPNPDSIYQGINALKKVPISIKKKRSGSKQETPPLALRSSDVAAMPFNGIIDEQLEREESNRSSQLANEIKSKVPAQSSSSETSVKRDTTSEFSFINSIHELNDQELQLQKNLIPCSNDGADPYVRAYLLPDKSWSGRKKTQVKKRTLNPQYNEKFEFSVSSDEVHKRKLDIAVKNNRSFGSHERKELGKVTFASQSMKLA
uniref:C2 domain-containing protein n=1 Tax=Callorhinchus milii TaxID=7868 RepID=A0A4W3H8Y4_CALMI